MINFNTIFDNIKIILILTIAIIAVILIVITIISLKNKKLNVNTLKSLQTNETDKFINHAILKLKIFLKNIEKDLKYIIAFDDDKADISLLKHVVNTFLNDEFSDISKTISRLYFLDSLKFKDYNLKKVKIDINDLVKRSIKYYEVKMTALNIEYNYNLHQNPLNVLIDYSLIIDAVSALIENSLKYMKKANGKITISTKNIGNNRCLIIINDNGVGMSTLNTKNLIAEYDNFCKCLTEKSGFGIGIKFASEVLKLHNGKIWFKSNTNEGFTSYIMIPLCKN